MSRESGGTVVVEGCAADGGREVVVRCGRRDRLIDCTLSASASREGVCRGQRALDCARFIVQTWKETSSIIMWVLTVRGTRHKERSHYYYLQ